MKPILIDNPNFGKPTDINFNYLKDCSNAKIYVPCGTCPECIANKQMDLVQRVQMEAMKNWLYMGTLTYKNETIPRLVTSKYYEYKYAKIQDFTGALKRLRKNKAYSGLPFRTIYVSERGGKFGRPHFHCLFLFKKEDIGDIIDAENFAQEHQWDLFNEWKRVTKKGRYSQSETLSDYRESIRNGIKHKTYDFHFVDPRLTAGGITDVAFYVLKYMLKGTPHEEKIRQALNLNYPKELANEYWQTIKSKQVHSIGFGLNVWDKKQLDFDIIEYLRNGIEESKRIKNPFAMYYCPEQILTFPLAKYYKEHALIYNLQDAIDFDKLNPRETIDNQYTWSKEHTQLMKKFNDYERKLKIVEQDCFSETLEELYET